MRLFEELKIKFEQTDWSRNPEFGLIDTILDKHPHLYNILVEDITKGCKPGNFGRKDTPSVEQIVRAAFYKEIKGLDYRDLEYHQTDSRICAAFVKIDEKRPYSFQMYHNYISKIRGESLKEFMVELNKIAINEGLEDINSIRQDTTVVESNIHYPTNNSLVWDCIRESHRLLKALSEEINHIDYRDYLKSAKRTYYKINVIKGVEKRHELFCKQLITFTKCINQVSNAIKKKSLCNTLVSMGIMMQLEELQEVMKQIYDVVYRKEIEGEDVPSDEKLFSIFERHTDIIVKGNKEVKFGHKVNLVSGRSNLVLGCEVLQGNPSDKSLFKPMLEMVINDYGIIPRDSVTDGGYASTSNLKEARKIGITNIVFNKIVGSLQNQVTSLNMETRLKKWRSGMEAVISNVKRGYNLFRCVWKGWKHFMAKIYWSIIAYNIRVMAAHMIEIIAPAGIIPVRR